MSQIGRLLGSGAGSDVYEYGDEKVCKLYKPGADNLDWEYNKLLDAYENGLPVPQVYGKIVHEGRLGYIMNRVYGISYLEIILEHICRSLEQGVTYEDIFNAPIIADSMGAMASYLHKLHQIKCKLRMSGKASLTYSCMNSLHLSKDEKDRVIAMIDALPDDECVCHGDPHAGNFIVNSGTVQMIDWNDCVTASPLYDIASLMCAMEYAEFAPILPAHTVDFFKQYKHEFVRVFIAAYARLSALDMSQINKWFLLQIIAHCNGNQSEAQTDKMVSDIRKMLAVL